jgi:G:T/U-mismatch repair DNA glycosylase
MEVNDFAALFARCPRIERVLLNGGTAKRVFLKYGARALGGREWVALPSTSPAYTLSYERKLAQWRQALNYENESL